MFDYGKHNIYSNKLKFSILFVKIAENSQVVDMVLLDLPSGMDRLRINSIAIWRCGGHYKGTWG